MKLNGNNNRSSYNSDIYTDIFVALILRTRKCRDEVKDADTEHCGEGI